MSAAGWPAASERSLPAAAIGRLALRSLYAELMLMPKPGLVSPGDPGAHQDMDAATFMRSLFALRGYFGAIAHAGARGAGFGELQALGLAAEGRMLAATGGRNTHRGAVFSLGLLAAAAGCLQQRGETLTGRRLGQTVRLRWGGAILAATPQHPEGLSHGLAMRRGYDAGGARREAVEGFPTLFEVALPALRRTLARTGSQRLALVQTLFTLVASLADTNLMYRGGRPGLIFAQRAAQGFLAAGGVHRAEWERHAAALHRAFIDRYLSPGGSADLLAGSWFVYQLQHGAAC